MNNLEERLAEEVRKHVNLYEVSARNYKDHQMSINSWEQISQNLGLSVEECKRSISSSASIISSSNASLSVSVSIVHCD